MNRILVTGATGFVGRHLVEALRTAGMQIVAAVREPARASAADRGLVALPFDLNQPQLLTPSMLSGVDCVYHLAACVHVMRRRDGDEQRFERLNCHATKILAETAARAGVRRFVYLSSIKVNGERTLQRPFREDDVPAPEDPYGRSKLEAERALTLVASSSGIEAVIVRPPLVYGPHVGANFRRIMWLADTGLPLPFGAIENQRSLVSVWNLVSLLLHVRSGASAVNRVCMAADGDDVSTPRLIELISHGLGKKAPKSLAMPVGVLRLLGAMTGMRAEIGRLVDSLQVDISTTTNVLGWHPPMSLDEGIARTAAWFKAARSVG